MKYTETTIKTALDNYFEKYELNEVRYLSLGAENDSILVDTTKGKFVLRFYGEEHGYVGKREITHILYEIDLMNFFRENNLPIPQVYKSISGDYLETIQINGKDKKYSLLELVNGVTPTNFSKEMVRQVAKVMAKMHNVVGEFKTDNDRSWPGTMIEMVNDRVTILEKSQEVSPQIDKVRELVLKWQGSIKDLDDNELLRGPIHGDIMFENMMFEGDKLAGIFDFDDCRESYFIEDIVKTLLHKFQDSSESLFGVDGKNVDVFLEEYQEIRSLSPQEEAALPLFFQTRMIYELTGYTNKKKYLSDRDQNIDNYLARYKKFSKFFE